MAIGDIRRAQERAERREREAKVGDENAAIDRIEDFLECWGGDTIMTADMRDTRAPRVAPLVFLQTADVRSVINDLRVARDQLSGRLDTARDQIGKEAADRVRAAIDRNVDGVPLPWAASREDLIIVWDLAVRSIVRGEKIQALADYLEEIDQDPSPEGATTTAILLIARQSAELKRLAEKLGGAEQRATDLAAANFDALERAEIAEAEVARMKIEVAHTEATERDLATARHELAKAQSGIRDLAGRLKLTEERAERSERRRAEQENVAEGALDAQAASEQKWFAARARAELAERALESAKRDNADLVRERDGLLSMFESMRAQRDSYRSRAAAFGEALANETRGRDTAAQEVARLTEERDEAERELDDARAYIRQANSRMGEVLPAMEQAAKRTEAALRERDEAIAKLDELDPMDGVTCEGCENRLPDVCAVSDDTGVYMCGRCFSYAVHETVAEVLRAVEAWGPDGTGNQRLVDAWDAWRAAGRPGLDTESDPETDEIEQATHEAFGETISEAKQHAGADLDLADVCTVFAAIHGAPSQAEAADAFQRIVTAKCGVQK